MIYNKTTALIYLVFVLCFLSCKRDPEIKIPVTCKIIKIDDDSIIYDNEDRISKISRYSGSDSMMQLEQYTLFDYSKSMVVLTDYYSYPDSSLGFKNIFYLNNKGLPDSFNRISPYNGKVDSRYWYEYYDDGNLKKVVNVIDGNNVVIEYLWKNGNLTSYYTNSDSAYFEYGDIEDTKAKIKGINYLFYFTNNYQRPQLNKNLVKRGYLYNRQTKALSLPFNETKYLFDKYGNVTEEGYYKYVWSCTQKK